MSFYLPVCLAYGGGTVWERLASWYQSSLIHELLSYLQSRYFQLELDAYENFSVSTDAAQSLHTFILAVCAGIIAAAFLAAYSRTGLGSFVRTLLREDCTAPERAKSLLELGFFRSPMIRRELSRGVTLRKVVYVVHRRTQDANEPEGDAAEGETAELGEQISDDPVRRRRLDLTTARFYIPEDLRYRAEFRFRRKGSGWGTAVLVSVLTVIATALVFAFMPKILSLIDGIISLLAP